jgi:hypothetical protein
MARKPVTKTAPETEVVSQTTAITNWDEELERQAEVAAGMEANSGGGQFFSMKAGVLSFNDMALPGNQMAVVIVDSVLENVFYEGKYDSENPTPPTCFAFGRDDLTIAPHETVTAKGQDQHTNCQGCPMNAWGTADQGRGKACRNTRRLGLLPAGTLDPQTGRFEAFSDVEQFATGPIGFMKLPVTSVKGYATFVKQVAGALKRPPHGIFTRIRVIPDTKTQFKVIFEPLGPIPGALMGAVMGRNEETKAVIEFPYSLEQEEKAKPAPKGGRGKPAAAAPKRPPVKGKKY